MKQQASSDVAVYCMEQLRRVVIQEPVYIIICWYEKDNLRDADNIAFGKKFIFDGLVARQVIRDDNRKNILGFHDFVLLDPEHPRVEVYIYPGEEGIKKAADISQLLLGVPTASLVSSVAPSQ